MERGITRPLTCPMPDCGARESGLSRVKTAQGPPPSMPSLRDRDFGGDRCPHEVLLPLTSCGHRGQRSLGRGAFGRGAELPRRVALPMEIPNSQ
jgi:hypothetical protein